jgi:hypothetical protein
MRGKQVIALPPPVAEPLPTPEIVAAKAALLEFSPEAMDEAIAELGLGDPALKSQALPSLLALPELTEPVGSFLPPPPPLPAAEPQKVTLQPIRKARLIPELEEIDSAMEAPPLKF